MLFGMRRDNTSELTLRVGVTASPHGATVCVGVFGYVCTHARTHTHVQGAFYWFWQAHLILASAHESPPFFFVS